MAIIGAGPAGSSCAIALRRHGVENLVIIDSSKNGRFSIGESVPPDINPVLRQLGVYEDFVAQGHEPCYGSCSYWGSDKRGYNDSLLNPFGHGWHLDRRQFNHFLVEKAENAGANLLRGCQFKSAQETNGCFQLSLKTSRGTDIQLSARIVVDASGHKAAFAIGQGAVKEDRCPMLCLGMRFKAKGRLEIAKLTHLESVEHGWWYAARVPGEQLLVTFFSDAETVKELALQKMSNWIDLLRRSPNTGRWVQNLEPADQRVLGFRAPSFCLGRMAGPNWIAIGDAASAYDPITSQGIIKAVAEGMRAAECIHAHLHGQTDVFGHFEKEVKTRYARYLSMRAKFYELEKRWTRSGFWQRMQKESITRVH